MDSDEAQSSPNQDDIDEEDNKPLGSGWMMVSKISYPSI